MRYEYLDVTWIGMLLLGFISKFLKKSLNTFIIKKLESAIAKDAKSVFDAKKSLWRNMGIRSFKELEDFAKTKELSTSTKYRAFQESIKVTF